MLNSLSINKAAFATLVVALLPALFSSSVLANDVPAKCSLYDANTNKGTYWYGPSKLNWFDGASFGGIKSYFFLHEKYAGHDYDFYIEQDRFEGFQGKASLRMSSDNGRNRQFKVKIYLKNGNIVDTFWLAKADCPTDVIFGDIDHITVQERCWEKPNVCLHKGGETP